MIRIFIQPPKYTPICAPECIGLRRLSRLQKDRASGLYRVLFGLLELSALAAPYIDRSTHHRRTAIHG